MIDLLPDSRPRKIVTTKGAVQRAGVWHEPIYCANCGADGGLVPSDFTSFAFYLCKPCYAAHGTIAGTYAMPDEVFWARVAEEIHEHYGRPLSEGEMLQEMQDPDSVVARLVRDRSALTPIAGD